MAGVGNYIDCNMKTETEVRKMLKEATKNEREYRKRSKAHQQYEAFSVETRLFHYCEGRRDALREVLAK